MEYAIRGTHEVGDPLLPETFSLEQRYFVRDLKVNRGTWFEAEES